MSVALLDINDSNLQLWQDGTPLRSPGYALLNGDHYLFGNPARAAARLRPREINTRFWWQLNTEPLLPALGPARHCADLAHAHLQDIHRQASTVTELILAVPGSMQRDQLALLLGIVQESPFTAVGLVNRSVALGSAFACSGRLFHLEIQLHQGVITELRQIDGQTELLRTTPLPGCGLLQLQERLIEPIATAFIRQTRFDPRRKAETEQLLYDTLPDALRALQNGTESNLEIGGYQARIERAELHKAGERLFSALAEAMGSSQKGDRLVVDPIATLLPGLTKQLPACEVAAANALWQSVSQHRDLLVQREQALNFVTALPCLEAAPAAEQTAPAAEQTETSASVGGHAEAAAQVPVGSATDREPDSRGQTATAPTHLLCAASARPLAAAGTELIEGCEVSREDQRWLLRGARASAVMVNGAPYRSGQALGAGDQLSLDDYRATLIEVLP